MKEINLQEIKKSIEIVDKYINEAWHNVDSTRRALAIANTSLIEIQTIISESELKKN